MDLNKLSLEIVNSIKELNLDSKAELSANIGMANFIYFLGCLEKDFKVKDNKRLSLS